MKAPRSAIAGSPRSERSPLCFRPSYTKFSYSDLVVGGGETIITSFTVTNTGMREGADVPQLYLTDTPNEKRMRLLGFEQVELRPVVEC
jgi:beta-glucosidase